MKPNKIIDRELSREGRPSEAGRSYYESKWPAHSENLLDLLLAGAEAPPRIEGVVVGTLEGFDDTGAPFVDFALNTDASPLPARATVELGETQAGREVALLFEQGDPRKPIVIGLMWESEEASARNDGDREAPNAQASVDGERLSLTAEREIVLRCGGASITLTRAGKVLIRGAFVLTDSSGVNRIRGGSVQIN